MKGVLERLTWHLGKFLGRWDVDPIQFHWLLLNCIKLDFRPRPAAVTAGKPGASTRSAMAGALVINLVMSGIIASVLVGMRASTFMYACALVGYGMFIVAAFILAEFAAVIVSPDDHLILAPRPVSSRTYFAVKLGNLAFYILLLSCALNILPAFIGLLSVPTSYLFPPVYFLVATMACVCTGGAVAAVYGLLLRLVQYERFKDLITYCHLGLSLIFIIGYQVLPRLASKGQATLSAHDIHPGSMLVPPFWFAGLVEVGLGHVTLPNVLLAAAALLASGYLVPKLIGSVSLDYSAHLSRLIAQASTVPATGVGLASRSWWQRVGWRRFFPNQEQRAFFVFLVLMFKRNRQLKMQVLPMFGVAAGLTISTLITQQGFGDPFREPAKVFIMIMPIMSYALITQGLVAAIPYSDEWQAAWIFSVLPIREPHRALQAMKKVVVGFVFLPLALISLAGFLLFCPFLHALALSIFSFVLGICMLQLLSFTFKHLPFTRRIERGLQTRAMLTALAMLPLLMGGMGILFLAVQGTYVFLTVLSVLVLLSLALGRWNNRRYARLMQTTLE